MKTSDITEQIIILNYYILDGIRKGDKKLVEKNKILLDNLIKLFLKDDKI